MGIASGWPRISKRRIGDRHSHSQRQQLRCRPPQAVAGYCQAKHSAAARMERTVSNRPAIGLQMELWAPKSVINSRDERVPSLAARGRSQAEARASRFFARSRRKTVGISVIF